MVFFSVSALFPLPLNEIFVENYTGIVAQLPTIVIGCRVAFEQKYLINAFCIVLGRECDAPLAVYTLNSS